MPIICESPREELETLHENLIHRGLVQNTPLTLSQADKANGGHPMSHPPTNHQPQAQASWKV